MIDLVNSNEITHSELVFGLFIYISVILFLISFLYILCFKEDMSNVKQPMNAWTHVDAKMHFVTFIGATLGKNLGIKLMLILQETIILQKIKDVVVVVEDLHLPIKMIKVSLYV